MRIARGAGREICKFGGDGLAEDQCAGILESRDTSRFAALKLIGRQTTAALGLEAIHVEDVFDPSQHSIQWRAIHNIRIIRYKYICLFMQTCEAILFRYERQ